MMLLEEFETGTAVIEPTDHSIRGGGEVCDTLILSFNGEVIERITKLKDVREGGALYNLNGRLPWYIYEAEGIQVGVMLAPIGASMIVGNLEELKAKGFRKFIILGTCGVLDKSIPADKIILPCSALRDEGTSYHYASASDEISYDPALLLTMEKALDQVGIEHVRAKTWTTDAFYRETAAKVKRRLAAGAMVVDMEASAIMAWANFRQAKVYQFFYTADYVDHHKNEWDVRWDKRQEDCMVFFEVAMTIAKKLESRSC
ncbi:Pnp/Udp family phosphorylase [Streptococcus ruminantium]|nr:Pnp/Udp family phosphorylase [Streptococcus ruminantium]